MRLKTSNLFLTFMLFVILFALVFGSEVKVVEADSQIIRIMEDGRVEGTSKIRRDGKIYTLLDDLNSSVGKDNAFIFIETHNIIVDGAGHTIKGTGNGTAFAMLRRQNVTIKNCNIEGFDNAFHFWVVSNFPEDSKYWGMPGALNNKILNNNITVTGTVEGTHEATGWAIFLRFQANNTLVSGNTIRCEDPNGGISDTGFNNTFVNNKLIGCSIQLSSSSQSIGYNNTINGTPCWILNEAENQVIDGAGQVFLFNCQNMTVKNVQPPSNQINAIQLTNTTNCNITNCRGKISIIESSHNFVYENSPKIVTISGGNHNKVFRNTIVNSSVCIELYKSEYNEVYENILLNSSNSPGAENRHFSGKNTVGIQLGESQLGGCYYNKVFGNNLVNHDVAIESYGGTNNSIYSNNIANSNVGISLNGAYYNEVHKNTITNCSSAVSIRGRYNSLYHNNFIENNNQISIRDSYLFTSDIITERSTNNTFDSGNLLGGNYWSNYNGTDNDGDGFGDTPFIINEENQDNYPLMQPTETLAIPEFPSWTLLQIALVVVVIFAVVYRRKLQNQVRLKK